MSTGSLSNQESFRANRDDFTDMLTVVHSGRMLAHLFMLHGGPITSEVALDNANSYLSAAGAADPGTQYEHLARGNSYAYYTGMPESIVTREPGEKGTVRPFEAMPLARHRAMPLGAFVVELCHEHDVSPFVLVGSRGKDRATRRPFHTRMSIYRTLLTAPEGLSAVELTEATEVPEGTIHNHLASLRAQGIISNERGEKRVDYPDFTVDRQAIASLPLQGLDQLLSQTGWNRHKKNLAKHLWVNFRCSATPADEPIIVSVDTVMQELDEHPELKLQYVKTRQTFHQRARVAEVLDFLEKSGLLKPIEQPKRLVDQVRLEKIDLIRTYLVGITRILLGDDDMLKTYSRLADKIAHDPIEMGWLLNVDFAMGAIERRRSTAEHVESIRRLLEEHGSITVSQIGEELGVSAKTASNILARAAQVLDLHREREGRTSRISLAHS